MLLTLVLIPFLIGLQYTVYDSQTYIQTYQEMYDTVVTEFDVLIKSMFARNWKSYDIHMDPRMYPNITTYLSLKLFCYISQNDRMMCRTGRYNNMYPPPSMMVSSSRLLRIKPDAFHNLGNPFEILFDYSGVYAFRFNHLESKQMIDVYRMIGNLLSIGTHEIDGSNSTFRTLERSTVGYCDTGYFVVQQFSGYKRPQPNYLTFFGQFFESDRILISRNRNINSCQRLSRYIFAPRFWPEFIPPSSVIERIKKSQSLITIFPQFPEDREIIQSQTENFYDFLDATGSVVGSVDETIILELKSVRMDKKANQFVGIQTTKELDVVNNNENFY